MKLMTCALCFLLGLTVAQRVVAALSIVNNGRSDYRIVVAAEANAQDLYAAKMLADYVEKISTARLAIVRDSTPPQANEIVIGFNGREFGVGTILSTQEITHFKTVNNDYSGSILSWIIHRVPSIKSQDIKTLFNTAGKDEVESLINSIRELEKHQSFYVDGEKHFAKIRDLAFWELLSK